MVCFNIWENQSLFYFPTKKFLALLQHLFFRVKFRINLSNLCFKYLRILIGISLNFGWIWEESTFLPKQVFLYFLPMFLSIVTNYEFAIHMFCSPFGISQWLDLMPLSIVTISLCTESRVLYKWHHFSQSSAGSNPFLSHPSREALVFPISSRIGVRTDHAGTNHDMIQCAFIEHCKHSVLLWAWRCIYILHTLVAKQLPKTQIISMNSR